MARELAEQLERDAAAAEAADAAMATAAQVSVCFGSMSLPDAKPSPSPSLQAEEAARLAQTLDAIAEKWCVRCRTRLRTAASQARSSRCTHIHPTQADAGD